MKKPAALDPIWLSGESGEGLIDLRLHATRLCFVAGELGVRCGDERWSAVSENLHLAASLHNLEADTDLTGNNYMCRTAAEYDEALSTLSERHLAGIIVFNLCWSAYEGGVELASGLVRGHQPKGALGRDILRSRHGDAHFPYLRQCLFASMNFIQPGKFEMPETRAMIRDGKLAAVAAELLRSFRNDVAHGSLPRPEPEDWGEMSKYRVDDDPAILKFHHHVRLLLVLIQIMILQTDAILTELSQLTEEWAPTKDVVTLLHCAECQIEDEEDAPELDLGLPRLAFSRF
ncbi:hypothetical protein [Sphingomonas sp. MS122]|uniref:hypothetical protein n=1 Tax=Sphingomonas sp. MS122 TaxID=3412683 RepID=UPI003C2DB392